MESPTASTQAQRLTLAEKCHTGSINLPVFTTHFKPLGSRWRLMVKNLLTSNVVLRQHGSEARLADAANISFRCHVSQQLKQWPPVSVVGAQRRPVRRGCRG